MTKVLQDALLDCLFDPGIDGDIKKAMDKAGYAPTTSVTHVVTHLYDEIVAVSEKQMARYLVEAVVGLGGAIAEPAQIGIKEKIKACTEIMDRTGVVKTDRINISGKMDGGTVFVLPAKNEDD